MAQGRHITPEKQLLNLIETHSAKTASVGTHAVRRQGMSIISPEAWLGRIAFFRDRLKKWTAGRHAQPDIKLLNTAILCLVSALAVYFLISLYFSIGSMHKMPTMKLSAQIAKEDKEAVPNVSVLKNAISYYVRKIRRRDIFKIGVPIGIIPTPAVKAAPRTVVPKVIDETKRYKLVGISWSKNPDAMIEDTVALRTFFVKRDTLLGRVKVEAIFKDKVVLSYEGEEVELK